MPNVEDEEAAAAAAHPVLVNHRTFVHISVDVHQISLANSDSAGDYFTDWMAKILESGEFSDAEIVCSGQSFR
jgi:hypothetical protein